MDVLIIGVRSALRLGRQSTVLFENNQFCLLLKKNIHVKMIELIEASLKCTSHLHVSNLPRGVGEGDELI